MVLLLAGLAVAAPLPCGTATRAVGASELPTPPRVVPAAGGKLSRDSYGVPHAHETANFVVRWGDQGGVDPADITALAQNLETVWRTEIEDMGYPKPLTTAWVKLNVYVGDSGDGAPESGGAAGYYWYDEDYYPMLVISSLMVDDPSSSRIVGAHEFFHGVQAATATYLFDDVAFWWWEATATWIPSEVFPGEPYQASLLWGQAFVPEQSINGYFYGQGGVLEFHPYGAFVFPTWLTEIAADPDLVRRSWVDAPTGSDPILVIEQLLAQEGWTLEEAFFDFARRNAVWHYEEGDLYAQSIAAAGGWSNPDSRRPTKTITGATAGWVEASSDLPHSLGANYWALEGLPDALTLAFEGDPGPTWHAVVAGLDGGEPAYAPIPLAAGMGEAELTGLASWTDTWLVVAAVDGTTDQGPVGGYRFRIDGLADTGAASPTADTGSPGSDTAAPHSDPPREIPPPADDGDGCGCTSAGSGGAGALAVVLALTAARRRRPSQ